MLQKSTQSAFLGRTVFLSKYVVTFVKRYDPTHSAKPNVEFTIREETRSTDFSGAFLPKILELTLTLTASVQIHI